ncbi:MAG: C4-dicarboxylate ABC transporter, partial [Spirochaetaceae bacterium]
RLEQELKDLGMTFVEVDFAAFQSLATNAVRQTLTAEQLAMYERIVNTR